MRAIVFTDLCDSTRHTHEVGDDAFTVLIREHDGIVRSTLDKRGGGEVKHTGDGIMASFVSVAAPDGIAVSSAVRDLCLGQRLDFDSKGELTLKGFPGPVPIFEVRFQGASPVSRSGWEGR